MPLLKDGQLRVGMTGTRQFDWADSRTVLAERVLGQIMTTAKRRKKEVWFNHGDCQGADAIIAEIAHDQGFLCRAFPGVDRFGESPSRGWTDFNQITEEPGRYFPRNELIVNASDLMLSFPSRDYDRGKGGTYHASAYTLRQGKPLTLFGLPGRMQDISYFNQATLPLELQVALLLRE